MDKKRKISIIIISVICIVFILIFILVKLNSNFEAPNDPTPNEADEYMDSITNTVQLVNNLGDYNVVRQCTYNFFNACENMFNKKDEDSKNIVYNMLGKEYKDTITAENVYDKIDKVENVDVFISNSYVIVDSQNIKRYIVFGNLRNTQTNEIKEFKLMIVYDATDNIFGIYPESYINDIPNNLELGQTLELNVLGNTEKNKDCEYKLNTINYEKFVTNMLDDLRKLFIYNPQKAYELLSLGQFANYDEFYTFIRDNMRDIILISFGDYTLDMVDNQRIYTCNDSRNCFKFKFNMESMFKYTYTIEKVQ